LFTIFNRSEFNLAESSLSLPVARYLISSASCSSLGDETKPTCLRCSAKL